MISCQTKKTNLTDKEDGPPQDPVRKRAASGSGLKTGLPQDPVRKRAASGSFSNNRVASGSEVILELPQDLTIKLGLPQDLINCLGCLRISFKSGLIFCSQIGCLRIPPIIKVASGSCQYLGLPEHPRWF